MFLGRLLQIDAVRLGKCTCLQHWLTEVVPHLRPVGQWWETLGQVSVAGTLANPRKGNTGEVRGVVGNVHPQPPAWVF